MGEPFEISEHEASQVKEAINKDDGPNVIAALRQAAVTSMRPETDWPLASIAGNSVWGIIAKHPEAPNCFLSLMRELSGMESEMQFRFESRSLIDLAEFARCRSAKATLSAELGAALVSFFECAETEQDLLKYLEMANRMASNFQNEVSTGFAQARIKLCSESERQVLQHAVSQAFDVRRSRLRL